MGSLYLNNHQKQEIENIIDYYCDNFDAINDQEVYKWENVNHFQKIAKKFNKESFSDQMEAAIDEFGNLLNWDIAASLKWLCRYESDKLWEMIAYLTNKSIDLRARLDEFVDESYALFEKGAPSYAIMNASAAMTILAFFYPDEYYIYRPFVLMRVAKEDCIGLNPPGDPIEKACYYNDLCEATLGIVRENKKLRDLYKEFLAANKYLAKDKKRYRDPKLHLLVQNVLYVPEYSTYFTGESVKVKPVLEHKKFADELHKVTSPNNKQDIDESKKDSKFNLDKEIIKEKANQKIGLEGEELVLEDEYQKLSGTDYHDCIEHVSKTRDNAHYDIRSYDLEGNEVYIEVKTSTRSSNWSIYFTQPEVEFSHMNPGSYCLSVVIKHDKNATRYDVHGDITDPDVLGIIYSPDATGYIVYLERKKAD